MTVSSTSNRVSFLGNGVSKTLSVTYPYLNKTNLKLYKLDTDGTRTTMTLGTDYTVVDIVDTNNRITGGTITFTTTPATGVQIVALREVDFTQETDYRENDIFPAETHETALDKLTMETQELKEAVSRSIKTNVISDIDPTELVTQIERIYDSIDNIDTTADNIADVNTVADDIDDVSTVAGSIANVNATGGSITNVNTVAGSISNVNTTAGSIANVNNVGNDIANVNSVAGDLTNIDAVNANKTNIDAVAGITSAVSDVSAIKEEVENVSDNMAEVLAVEDDLTSIVAVANDLTNIDAASTHATNAANSAADAKKWAIGDPSEPTGYSAKWWAEHTGFDDKGDYSSTTTYSVRDFVRSVEGNVYKFYSSLVNDNLGNPLSDTTKWKLWWTVQAGGSVSWGNIDGSITNQTDLINKMNDYIGKTVQLGFDGTLENTIITFEHSTEYTIDENKEYEIDLLFAASGTLDDNYYMRIKNGSDYISFVNVLDTDSLTAMTVGNMKQLMRYNSSTGFRWLFRGTYKITSGGQKVFLIYPVVSNDTRKANLAGANTFTGTNTFSGNVVSSGTNSFSGANTFSNVPKIATSTETTSTSTDSVNVAYLHNQGYATFSYISYIDNIFSSFTSITSQSYTAIYDGFLMINYGATCSEAHNSSLSFTYKGQELFDMLEINQATSFSISDHGNACFYLKRGENLTVRVLDNYKTTTDILIYYSRFYYLSNN